MKKKLLHIVTAVTLFSIPNINFAQAPSLGVAANFVLFSTVGAIGNTGISQLTGNVGTNSGSTSGFGNVNGVMGANPQCATDLLKAYNKLDSTKATFFPAPLLGGGQIIFAGVDSIGAAATLDLDLILDAQGNPNAVFIFKIQGPFSTNANSKVKLINGALACNVFWKVEGLVDMASGTTMRGTIIANNAAINMNAGDTLEGRALSTSGAVTVDGVLAYVPTGCGSLVLNGPAAPALATTECYAIFSASGPVTNSGATYVTGDVGTNVGLTTGYNPLFVTGMIHPIADASTAQCATDLGVVYTYLNTLTNDIELMYPAQFGGNLVLTPHVYIMNAATVLTDTLYLDARNNTNAIFVIKIFGALSTTVNSKVKLINGTQSKNVYWTVDGAVSINDYSVFRGTIICNNGAISLNTGIILDGRALTTTGTLTTTVVSVIQPQAIGAAGTITGNPSVCQGQTGVIYSVPAIANATGYTWVLPTGATIAAGANTNSITVDFNATASSGTITVQGSNFCAVDLASASYSVTVCTNIGIHSINTTNDAVTIYPNPFSTFTTILTNNTSLINTTELKLYDVLGAEVMRKLIIEKTTTLETSNLSPGIYFYKIICNNKIIQSGKLISQQ